MNLIYFPIQILMSNIQRRFLLAAEWSIVWWIYSVRKQLKGGTYCVLNVILTVLFAESGSGRLGRLQAGWSSRSAGRPSPGWHPGITTGRLVVLGWLVFTLCTIVMWVWPGPGALDVRHGRAHEPRVLLAPSLHVAQCRRPEDEPNRTTSTPTERFLFISIIKISFTQKGPQLQFVHQTTVAAIYHSFLKTKMYNF